MRVRAFGLGVPLVITLLAAPGAAGAQAAAKIHRIGLLESASSNPAADTFGQWGAFREGLRTLGYVEGRTWRSSRDGPTTSMSGSPTSPPSSSNSTARSSS